MKICSAILALLLFSGPVGAEPPGLTVGATAPAFTLASSTGGSLSLDAALAAGPVALVFVRSADWCPFCRNQLKALEAARPDFEAAGLRLVALSYDAPATNAAAAEKLGLGFPLLSDVGSKVIDAYGIRNREATGRGDGIPHPTVFIVDRAGMIRVKLARESYRDRPESAEIIAAWKALR